jgi:Pyruvate/2-oxoacid:ferredoxin oxidoreductase gamma subunit
MGKKVLPKRIAGVKVPKRLRQSRLLRSLLRSPLGREILANALTAGAGAAASVLVRNREEIAEAGEAGARKGRRTLGTVAEAMESAADAAMEVITEAARSMLPDEKPAPRRRSAGRSAGREVRH